MTLSHYLRRLGRRIKAARRKCGLRQIDIEERIGLAVRHYQQIEAGRVNVTIETLFRLSKLYETDLDRLMPRQSPKNESDLS